MIDTLFLSSTKIRNTSALIISSLDYCPDENVIAHERYEKYDLDETKVLSALSCRVASRAKGIGCAECHWEATKRHKKAKNGKLGSEVMKKFLTMSVPCCNKFSVVR